MRVRYHYLDLVRGFAALAVLINHYRFFYTRHPGDWQASEAYVLPFSYILQPIYDYGDLAVQLFWVLSGFVFAIAYGDDRRTFSAREFAAYRLSRLYPVHLITLAYVAFIQSVSIALRGAPQVYGNNDALHFVAHLFMASNWFTIASSFNAPVWSVSVEILIYVVFVCLIKRYGLSTWRVFALAGAFFFAERLSHSVIAWCGALFFIGCATSIVLEYLHSRVGRSLPLIGVVGAIAVCAAVVVLARVGHGGHHEVILAYFLMPCVIFAAAGLDRIGVPFPQKLTIIGALTYSLYMVHMPLVITAKLMLPAVFSTPNALASPLVFIAYVGTAIVLGYGLYKAVELPAQRLLGDRLAPRTLPPALAELERKAV